MLILACCCHIVTLKYLPQEVKLQHQKTDNNYKFHMITFLGTVAVFCSLKMENYTG